MTTSNNAMDSELSVTYYVPVKDIGLIKKGPEKNSKGRDWRG